MFQPSPAALRSETSMPAGPSPRVDAPLDPRWAPCVERLEGMVSRAAARLAADERRAQRLTVQVRFADGKRKSRTVELARATDRAGEVKPIALALLWMLTAEAGMPPARLSVRLSGLVEGENQPIRFERYLARRRPQGLARLAGVLVSLGLVGSLIGR